MIIAVKVLVWTGSGGDHPHLNVWTGTTVPSQMSLIHAGSETGMDTCPGDQSSKQ